MTPTQAIVASTSEVGKLLHRDEEVGTLEEGKLALVMKARQIVKSQMEVGPRITAANIS
jgi:imidazolonepropionase-like amidohydrolase